MSITSTKRKLAFKLFNWLEPKFRKLEQFVIAERTAVLQAIQNELAEQYFAKLQRRKYAFPQFFLRLIKRPAENICPHLKGGSLRNSFAFRDHSVNLHTFLDGSQKVRCTICGKVWTPQSPDWAKALEMVHQSTNTPSSSEISLSSKIGEPGGNVLEQKKIVIVSADRPD